MKNIIICLTTLILFYNCKKKDNPPVPSSPTNTKNQQTFLISYNVPNAYEKDTLQAIVYDSLGHSAEVFGIRGSDGKVKNISSMNYYNGERDTITTFVYNSDKQVESIYSTINGIKDSILFNFIYKDSIVTRTVYSVDWSKDSLKVIESKNFINKNGQLSSYRLSEDIYPTYVREGVALALKTAAIVAGATVVVSVVGACIASGGVPCYIVGVGLLVLGIEAASAEERKEFDKLLENPAASYNSLKNKNKYLKGCVVKIDFPLDGFGMDYRFEITPANSKFVVLQKLQGRLNFCNQAKGAPLPTIGVVVAMEKQASVKLFFLNGSACTEPTSNFSLVEPFGCK